MTYPADKQGNLGEEVSYYYETLHDANLTTVQSDIGNGTAYATNMKYNLYGQLTSLQHRRSTPIVQEYQYYSLIEPNGQGRLQEIRTLMASAACRTWGIMFSCKPNLTGFQNLSGFP